MRTLLRSRTLAHLLLPLSLALAASTSGCAAGRAECRLHGGAEWRALQSQHFRIRTDATPEVARETAIRLERMRRAMLLAFGTDFDPPSQVDVVLLRNLAEYREFAGEGSVGLQISPGTDSLMLLPVSEGEAQVMPATVAHELVHDLSRHRLLRQPRWVAEGLAGDLENAELSEDGRFAYLGKVPSWARTHGVDTRDLLALDALWDWERRAPTDEALERHYRSAWAWSVFLRNRHGERLAEFHRRLGIPEEPHQAFDAAFSGVDPRALDRELRDYFDKGLNYFATWQLPEAQVEIRELGAIAPEDVHALRMRLLHLPLDPRKPEALRRRHVQEELELARAISAFPVQAELEALRLGLAGPDREAAARVLVQRAPDVAEAWRLLATTLQSPTDQASQVRMAAERRQALEKAHALAPEDAGILNHLAWEYVHAGEAERAVGLASRALERAPWSASVIDTWAAALGAAGRCEDAAAAQRRAVDALHERTPPEGRERFLGRLRYYETGCVQAASATSGAD